MTFCLLFLCHVVLTTNGVATDAVPNSSSSTANGTDVEEAKHVWCALYEITTN